jgi:hypothetical protein
MFLRRRVRAVHKADNLTAICEPIVLKCGILNISEPYRPPRTVTRKLYFREPPCTSRSCRMCIRCLLLRFLAYIMLRSCQLLQEENNVMSEMSRVSPACVRVAVVR